MRDFDGKFDILHGALGAGCFCFVVALVLGWFVPNNVPIESQLPSATATPIPLAPHVRLYLFDNYAIQDFSGVQVVSREVDYCMGVYCEYWVIRPPQPRLRLMLRCYPDFAYQCAPTYEEFGVRPAPGSEPTVTPYAAPTRIQPGSGVGAPES